MEDEQHTIGLQELLSQVDRDLDDLRKKHPSDFSVRGITLWWELERERVLARHGSATVVRKPRIGWVNRHTVLLFTAGAVTWVVGELLLVLLRR